MQSTGGAASWQRSGARVFGGDMDRTAAVIGCGKVTKSVEVGEGTESMNYGRNGGVG